MEQISFLNIQYFFYLIYKLLTGGTNAPVDAEAFAEFWATFKIISTIVSLLLLVGIVYSIIRIRQLRSEEKYIYGDVSTPYVVEEQKNERWEQILEHIESDNPNDWRLAILEADVILDEMVSHAGYEGETLGEKLKTVEKSDFITIQNAWDAHKVRNQIAHEGSDFVLTQRKARETIRLYQNVFEEFHFI